MTADLPGRVFQHGAGLTVGSFTAKYRTNVLVYYEALDDIVAAIRREKQIKGWTRRKKIALIESTNPAWADLLESVVS